MIKKLMVVTNHKPSVLLAKGEYIPRYYNPENLFDEVHLLLTNRDHPDPADLQKPAGRARVFIHNLPTPDIRWTLGWQIPLIRPWLKRGVELARQVNPNLMRVHNNFQDGYLGREIKQRLGIPYVLSIHHSHWQHAETPSQVILRLIWRKFEASSVRAADGVIAVYSSNLHYAEQLRGNNPQLIYNVVSDQIPAKRSYALGKPPRLITVSKQFKYKNPANIIRAVQEIDCEYLIVGTGEYHGRLVTRVHELGMEDKVRFVKSVDNAQLTRQLKDFDLHVTHCDNWGMSKTVTEASLAGLPTLINYHPVRPIPEYEGDWLARCENTPEGYATAIKKFLADTSYREEMGRRAHQHSKETFDPMKMEAKLAQLYRDTMRP
jgi:glycosyltransferase involved in cell wall biosynthesis